MQALGQQVTDKKQQEDYERKRELAFGMYIYASSNITNAKNKSIQFALHDIDNNEINI